MKGFLVSLLSAFCFCCHAFAGTVEIRGKVCEPDGAPVMYASVALISEGTVLTGTMTGTDGSFLLKFAREDGFIIKVSSIGYNDISVPVQCKEGQGKVDVGVIRLTQTAVPLRGASVTAEQTARSMTVEKERINPSSSMSTATGSVLEVIRGASSVTVDGSGNVSIRGNSNVLVLVDGVPTALGGLASIPAANVQSIDIVTSPDVRYDSEGTGGIISITSKKQQANSTNAMASFNYGFNGFLNGNLAVNCNQGVWGVRVNYNGRYENDLVESELHRRIKVTGNSLSQIVNATKRTVNHNLGVNLNLKATSRDVLTLDLKAIFPRLNNFQNFDNRYTEGGVPETLFRQTDITFNRETFEGSLGYRHIFEPGKKELSLNCSVSSITGHRPSYYYEEGIMVQKSVSGGHPFNTSLQADYSTSSGKGRFETGAKMSYRQNNIDHKMYELSGETGDWNLSVPLSNDLKHREYIPAAYAMYSSRFAERLSFRTGVRLEYSYVTLHSDREKLDSHSDCFFVAPSFMLNFRMSEPWSLTAGFSRRISRPSYPQLNPYVNLIDRQTYETGNMNLQPEKTGKLDLGYSYTSKRFSVTGAAYFSHTVGYINQVAALRDNILVMTYINGDMDLKTGIDHSIRLNPFKWLSMDIASDTWYSLSRGAFEGARINNRGWVNNSNVSLDFKPLKGMTFQPQYFVTTPQYFPQFTTSTIHYCNLGIKQSFLKNSLSVSALLTDVFNTRRWDIRSDNAVYSLVNNSKNLSRMLWIGVTWNFNSYKPLKAAQKKEDDRSIIRLGD